VLELHFIVSFWAEQVEHEHTLAGGTLHHFDKSPLILLDLPTMDQRAFVITIRRSEEDARQIWKLITDEPLKLSLPYVATISVREDDESGSRE
jgi:hypothetical protein